MSGTLRRKALNKRKAFYRDFARRDDRAARKIKAMQARDVTRAERRLAALQSQTHACQAER
jgi:hypothetical protein